ncbi:hypothetical protein [Candidatus Methanoplasma termitum]|uniref:hypothetical protein n=1 Tax=Candidatus Methanoplasma termitum TaxID=1577791 RepID=UPI0011DD9F65|nr:hypothetical protein [Candidatus Methanoplasma termitum]
MFLTDKQVDDVASLIEKNDDYTLFEYRDTRFHTASINDITPDQIEYWNPNGIRDRSIPDMFEYWIAYGSTSWSIFDFAKEYLKRVGDTVIVIEVCLGHPIPPYSIMPEITVDIRDFEPVPSSAYEPKVVWMIDVNGEGDHWHCPQSFIDTFPDEMTLNNNWPDDTNYFEAYSYSKSHPYFSAFKRYRLIDTGVKRTSHS